MKLCTLAVIVVIIDCVFGFVFDEKSSITLVPDTVQQKTHFGYSLGTAKTNNVTDKLKIGIS